ncbi:MAG: DUF523 domain-containing protein [Kiritimatiellaeota bacterium]|nr:DUF523 domain-containing protein [Kiritimatiellota bacterium]
MASACLVGRCCRYDTEHRRLPLVTRLMGRADVRVVAFCPEVAGGLSVPRSPAAISGGDGGDVLDGLAVVRTVDGRDVTAAFLSGARKAVELVRRHKPDLVVLKARSPSCGLRNVHCAETRGALHPGAGVTAALLRRLFPELPLCTEEELADASLVRSLPE